MVTWLKLSASLSIKLSQSTLLALASQEQVYWGNYRNAGTQMGLLKINVKNLTAFSDA